MPWTRSILATAIALTALGSGDAPAVEPRRPGQQNFISRAVFASGRLWMLSDAGDVSSIAPGASVRHPEKLPEPALDLCVTDGHVGVLTCPRDACKAVTFRRLISNRWTADAPIALEGEDVAAIACAPQSTTILTDKRLIENVAGRVSALPLSGTTRRGMGLVTSIHVTADHVFAGINAGEWGGGLKRIARKSGQVTVVEKNATGGLCGGPLNTACNPVNGLSDEPWKPGCIAAAIGLVHFSPHGRLVEICKGEVREIFVKDLDAGQLKVRKGRGSETVAFFGLTRVGKTLLASGIDGLYRFDGSAAPKHTPLPKFDAIDGVGVSFAIPDAVLVLTAINQRRSMSGNVPLLVPRTPENNPYAWFDATFAKLRKRSTVPTAPANWSAVKTKDGLTVRLGPAYRPRTDGCWNAHTDKWPGPGWKDVCLTRQDPELLQDDFRLRPVVEGDGRAALSDDPSLTDVIVHDSWSAEAAKLQGRRAIIERARASGGMAGRKRERTLTALIELGTGEWVRFTGKTGDDAGYDELLAIASTIEPATP